MGSLSHRSTEAEIMDDLDCSGDVLAQTLRELEFINKWLGGNAVTLNAVARIFRSLPKDRKYRIVDVGCGGGDMARHIYRWGLRNGFDFEVIGIDANPNVISFAKRHKNDPPAISFRVLNVFSKEFQDLKCDVVIGTLFYHHFSREQLVDFFAALHHQVSLGFVINDIHRHFLALHSIRFLTSIFSKSPMVKYDAPLSVRRAFARAELEDVLVAAGYKNFTIRWKWAFRWEVVVRMN